jgi:hypothetical protein
MQMWEGSNDEDKRGLTTIIFERIVFDLDTQRIVDFRLKSWVEKYFVLRVDDYEGYQTGSIPVGGTQKERLKNESLFVFGYKCS